METGAIVLAPRLKIWGMAEDAPSTAPQPASMPAMILL
jgi:hypothetical protein